MAKLSAARRKSLPKASFAVPKGKGSNPRNNSYPVHDAAHARNALARVAQHGTPAEQAMAKRKVKAKFPQVAVCQRQVINSAVTCPECRAGQGEPCRTEGGGPRKKMHWDRVETWQGSPWSVKFPRSVTSEDIDQILRVVREDDT